MSYVILIEVKILIEKYTANLKKNMKHFIKRTMNYLEPQYLNSQWTLFCVKPFFNELIL